MSDQIFVRNIKCMDSWWTIAAVAGERPTVEIASFEGGVKTILTMTCSEASEIAGALLSASAAIQD